MFVIYFRLFLHHLSIYHKRESKNYLKSYVDRNYNILRGLQFNIRHLLVIIIYIQRNNFTDVSVLTDIFMFLTDDKLTATNIIADLTDSRVKKMN